MQVISLKFIYIQNLIKKGVVIIFYNSNKIINFHSNQLQMSQNIQKQQQQIQQKYKSRGIFYGVFIFLIQLGMIIVYALQSKFVLFSFQETYLSQYFGLIVTVIGLGLILCFYSRGSILGLATAIIAFAFNFQLGPLFQQFWYNVFLGQFDNNVNMSLVALNTSAAMTISYLLSSLATIGRLGIFQIVTSILVYNIMWPVAYFCNLKIAIQQSPNSGIWDDLGGNYIFVFAAIFGMTYSAFLSTKSGKRGKANAKTSKKTSVLSLLGTCFTFVGLPWIGYRFFQFNLTQNLAIHLSAFNIYFSMIGSIVSTQAFGLLFGRQKLSIEGAMIGMIAGAAISSTIAGLDQTFSGYFAAGCFAGFLCGFWIQVVHPRINKVITFDSLGLFSAVFLSSLFGSLVMAPIFQKIYLDNGWTILTLGVGITDGETMKYQVIYYFLTVGSAFVGGVIAGFIGIFSRQEYKDYKFSKVFDRDYGLYHELNKYSQVDHEHESSAKKLNINVMEDRSQN